MTPIVKSETPITLIGGGPVEAAQLTRAVAMAPLLVAADSGANRAHDVGYTADHIIGDMDSVDISVLDRIPAHLIAEQMSTDLDKCLYATEAPYYIGVGFTGGRLDHQLAACHSLVNTDKRVILVGEYEICFRAPLAFSLNLPVGTRLSLFPLGKVSGTSSGLKWPIDGLKFAPDSKIGTSNKTNVDRVELTFDQPHMLVILPAKYLETLVTQLCDLD